MGLGSDPTDIRDTELAGEKGATSVSVSNMKLAMVLLVIKSTTYTTTLVTITITRVSPCTTVV